MAPTDVVDPLIYDGLVEELIEVLEIKNLYLQVGENVYGCGH
jgi:fructose 1,6-bisphosphatase